MGATGTNWDPLEAMEHSTGTNRVPLDWGHLGGTGTHKRYWDPLGRPGFGALGPTGTNWDTGRATGTNWDSLEAMERSTGTNRVTLDWEHLGGTGTHKRYWDP